MVIKARLKCEVVLELDHGHMIVTLGLVYLTTSQMRCLLQISSILLVKYASQRHCLFSETIHRCHQCACIPEFPGPQKSSVKNGGSPAYLRSGKAIATGDSPPARPLAPRKLRVVRH